MSVSSQYFNSARIDQSLSLTHSEAAPQPVHFRGVQREKDGLVGLGKVEMKA